MSYLVLAVCIIIVHLILAGEQINIHDLTTFDFRATLGGKRAGANIFAVDDSGTRLAIAVKKKVYIMHWNGRQYIDYPRVHIIDY